MHVAQIIDLLAWEEVLRRRARPRAAGAVTLRHDRRAARSGNGFRPAPPAARILGTIATERSVSGLIDGLGDARFEVRYHCSSAIDRILTKTPRLHFDRSKIIAVIERELSVPPQRWRGYHLLDRPEAEPAGVQESSEDQSRHLEHIFQLLSTIVGREPLDAAVHGVRSPLPGLRGLAIEYLDRCAAGRPRAARADRLYTVRRRCSCAIRRQPTARQSSGETEPGEADTSRRDRPAHHAG